MEKVSFEVEHDEGDRAGDDHYYGSTSLHFQNAHVYVQFDLSYTAGSDGRGDEPPYPPDYGVEKITFWEVEGLIGDDTYYSHRESPTTLKAEIESLIDAYAVDDGDQPTSVRIENFSK